MLRTLLYVVLALSLALLVGYPVAYFAARHAGRWKGLVLVLLILPFWINYLMRMLAWINLLGPDGLATRFLRDDRDRARLPHDQSPLRQGGMACRPAGDGDPRAHLRLPPVPDPAVVRIARPDRPAADRGSPRSRGRPGKCVSAGHLADVAPRDPRRARVDLAADVRGLLHRRISSRSLRRRACSGTRSTCSPARGRRRSRARA